MPKKYLIGLSLMFFILLSFNLWSQAISYTRLTEGLHVPTFEGGRSDFVFADINLDGRVDILSIGDHGNPNINSTQSGLLIWFNIGNNQFQNIMIGFFGYGGMSVGDVNNDGFPDVAMGMHHNYSTTNFGNQLIEVALGDGTGMNWLPWDVGLATAGESWGMFGTELADVNNDGLLDVVSISMGCCDGLQVYLNQGNGTWLHSFGFLGNNSDNLVYVCDINNDGYLDIVASHAQGTAYFGDGTGNFVKNDTGLPSIGANSTRSGIAVGDINNNGNWGLAYVNASGGILAFEWDNLFNTWVNYSGNLPASGNFRLAQLWDMNADGYLDVMAFGNRTFKLWLGNGMGNWTESTTFQTPNNPGYARAFRAGGDLNKTGIGDIVILAEEGTWYNYKNKLYVYADNTQPDSLWIRLLYPKGNERFYPGSARFINWAAGVPGAVPAFVRIEISAFGPNGPWWLLADNLPNNGRHQWIIPNYGSQQCYLKITITNGFQSAEYTMTKPFTIFGQPTTTAHQNSIRFNVFPNPGNDFIRIHPASLLKSFQLLDIMGKPVLSSEESGEIYSGNLKDGVYIYQIIDRNQNVFRGKWMKHTSIP